MTSRYVTFILRLRFDDLHDPVPLNSIHGSFQQVGMEKPHHFVSFDKFLEIFRETVDQAVLSLDQTEENHKE